MRKYKFETIKKWLTEQQTESNNDSFGCVMLDAKISDWEEYHTSGIDPKDIMVKPYDESYGIENNPHVTILYGIHEDEVDPMTIMDIIKENLEPVTVEITNISIFENEEYDVVKYDVPVTPQLQKYRDMFEKTFSNTQTFPGYHPHVTLAYVKPGEGKKYVKELADPFMITFGKGVYSFHEYNEEGDVEDIRKEHVFKTPEDIETDLSTPFSSLK